MSRIAEKTARGHTYIIAEIGQNHQGDPSIARQLIDTAAAAGVDAVKSQKRHIPSLLTEEEYNRPYDNPHSFGRTYGDHRERLELSIEQHLELKGYAESKGLDYFCSPWDPHSLNEMVVGGFRILKIASALITHLPLLDMAAESRLPVILSTGMSELDVVDTAVDAFKDVPEMYVLQCTSSYPSQFEDVNLRVLPMFHERYGRPVGFSGHHRGISIDVAAVALGACMIERHFTLDRTWKGTDHAASLEPPGLFKLVRDVRSVEVAMGDGHKRMVPAEQPVARKLRKVVARA